MSYAILIRHSISLQEKARSAHHWSLTDAGRMRCDALAQRLRGYDITRYISSDEPKAIQTAQQVVGHLKGDRTSPMIDRRLRETTRETAPYFENVDEFRANIRRAMYSPDELLFGEETFKDALTRFSAGVADLVMDGKSGSLAMFTHGTVMSLYIAQQTGLDAFGIWQLLDMPSFAVFRLPSLEICEICFSVNTIF
ncbi:MAG: histidine phosphatase family protein [Anaerolineaceae bacterium]|nr:MAG: histidine phosphatase family protein [Anaerolineaceae bacterium]